jgi:hypothetical protein
MTLKEIRVRNGFYWAEKYGRTKLAEMLGYPDVGYLNQLVKGHGSFGDKTARKFEQAIGLDELWMDRPHPELWGIPDENLERYFDEMISGMTPDQLSVLFKVTARKFGIKS